MNTRGLTELGMLLFLDRYSKKCGTRESLKVGDTVLVQINGQKIIGELAALHDNRASVIIGEKATSEAVVVDVEAIDKPLELDPAEMWQRVAQAVAEAEQTSEKFEEWHDKFKWLLEDWKFLPGGRILAAAGTNSELTYFNCYVIPSPGDSKTAIFNSVNNMAQLHARGGGVGINISTLRPRYAYAKSTNGRSSGAVSWGELYSYTTGLIEQGGSRRGATLLMLADWHPDVMEYINVKRDMKRIINANISIAISEEFMKAVELNDDWQLKFPDTTHPDYDVEWHGDMKAWQAKGYPIKVWKTMKARELWDAIINSAWACAEPGLWFIDRVNAYSNSHYFAPLISTNPCVTGDTLVAVADGRNAVSIKQLAKEGLDVPVHCYAPGGEGITISVGRNPRLTGKSSEVWKVTLDDGSSIKVTANHKFLLRDGTYKTLNKLVVGDRLMPFTKRHANATKQCGGHWYVWHNSDGYKPEHRMIMEFIIGRKLLPHPEEVIHHINEDSMDNVWTNLQLLSQSEHISLHQQGDNNVMRDKWWNKLPEEDKEQYKQHMSIAVSGDRNGMYGRHHSDTTKALISEKRIEAWNRMTDVEREQIAANMSKGMREAIDDGRWIPYERTSDIRAKISQSLTKPRILVTCLSCGKPKHVTEDYLIKEPIKAQSCSDNCYNTILTGKSLNVRRSEGAKLYADSAEGKVAKKHAAITAHINSASKQAKWMLEQSLPIECWDEYRKLYKQQTGNYSLNYAKACELVEDLEQAGMNYNHAVQSIEYAGIEDVYNITVDNHHTVAYITNVNDKGYTGIVTAQCGEISLPEWGCCNLGSINLSKFVVECDGEWEVNWMDLELAVQYAVRFLDNVIDATPYAYEEIKKQQLSERRVGLGTMGLAEVLIKMKLRYGSDDAIEFIDKLYSAIAHMAYRASIAIAREKGSFPKFSVKILESSFMKGMPSEIREEVEAFGLRNITLLTQAPTGTIGTMVNTSTGIEPFYYWEYERKGRFGSHTERVKVFDEYIQGWKANVSPTAEPSLPDYFVTAQDLTPEEHVKVQAAIQRWVDSSISKTCNVPEDYTVEQVSELYKLMYELGCKGGTIYRDKSRSEQVLNLKPSASAEQAPNIITDKLSASLDKPRSEAYSKPASELAHHLEIRNRPAVIAGKTYKKLTPEGTCFITLNSENGQPFETFINIGKAGSDVANGAEAIGRLVSMAFRASNGNVMSCVTEVVSQLRGIGGKSVGFGANRVSSVADALAQVLEAEYLSTAEVTKISLGELCPGCGNYTVMHIEGCRKCDNCGFAQC